MAFVGWLLLADDQTKSPSSTSGRRSKENFQLRKLQVAQACRAAHEALGRSAEEADFVLMGDLGKGFFYQDPRVGAMLFGGFLLPKTAPKKHGTALGSLVEFFVVIFLNLLVLQFVVVFVVDLSRFCFSWFRELLMG